MKKEKKDILNHDDILARVKFIGIFLIIVLICIIYLLLMSKIDSLERYLLTENIVLEHNGKKVYQGNIEKYQVKNVKSEDTFVIYMKIPDVNVVNPTLKYDNVNTAVDIYQDNELVYSIGKETPKGGVLCHAFNKVPLKKIKKNQEIKMCIRVLNGSVISLLPSVELMNAQDSDLDYFYNMLVYIIMGVYLLVMGVIGLLIASYNRNKDIINKKLITLSFCNLTCAMYFMSLYQVIPIFSDNLLMDAYCEYITTVGVILMLNLYLAISNPKGKKGLSIALTIILSIYLVAEIGLQILRISAFNDTMYLFTGLMLLSGINFLITYSRNIENFMSKKVLFFILSIVLALLVFYTLISIFFSNLKENVLIVIPIVLSIVLSVEFIELIYGITKSLVTNAQKQALMDMAYIDKFTGLFNRRGLDMHISECVECLYDVYLFDINGLKRINDAYGHKEGDYIIKSFANELRDVFNDGFCVRLGGDEFVVIREEKNRTENPLEKLSNNIKRINTEGNKEYLLEYAVGHSKYIPDKDVFEDVIKEADKEMYKMKNNK